MTRYLNASDVLIGGAAVVVVLLLVVVGRFAVAAVAVGAAAAAATTSDAELSGAESALAIHIRRWSFFLGIFFYFAPTFVVDPPPLPPSAFSGDFPKRPRKRTKKNRRTATFFFYFFFFSLSLSLSLSLSTKLRFVFSLVTAHSEKRRLQGLLFSFATLSLLFFSAVPLLPQLAPLLLSIFFSFSGSSSYSPAWPREVRE